MRCLFIGGCADGKWIDVAEGQRDIRVPFQLEGGGFANDVYSLMRLPESDGEVLVTYVHAGTAKPLRRLIEGYRGVEVL